MRCVYLACRRSIVRAAHNANLVWGWVHETAQLLWKIACSIPKKLVLHREWWPMPVVLTLGSRGGQIPEFQARPCLKQQQKVHFLVEFKNYPSIILLKGRKNLSAGKSRRSDSCFSVWCGSLSLWLLQHSNIRIAQGFVLVWFDFFVCLLLFFFNTLTQSFKGKGERARARDRSREGRQVHE